MDDIVIKHLPVRKYVRLKGYDYSQNGAYFITVCVKDRHKLLWEDTPVGAHIVRPPLSETGKTVRASIENIPKIYTNIAVDKYTIMPNHFHMILCINASCVNYDHGRTLCAPTTVSRIIKHCKEYVTKQIGYPIWQKSYHDHIIRNEAEYRKIWKYIDENPTNWQGDCYFVQQQPSQNFIDGVK